MTGIAGVGGLGGSGSVKTIDLTAAGDLLLHCIQLPLEVSVCVSASGAPDWEDAGCTASQAALTPRSLWSSNWKASGVLPATFCLPPTLWSFTPVYWVGSRENICFHCQSVSQEIKNTSDSACSPFFFHSTCFFFSLPPDYFSSSQHPLPNST